MINAGFDIRLLNFEDFNRLDDKNKRHGLYIEGWMEDNVIEDDLAYSDNRYKWFINYEHGIKKGMYLSTINNKIVNLVHVKNTKEHLDDLNFFGEEIQIVPNYPVKKTT